MHLSKSWLRLSHSAVLDSCFCHVCLVEGCFNSSMCLKQICGLFLVIKVVSKKAVYLNKMLNSTQSSLAVICRCFFPLSCRKPGKCSSHPEYGAVHLWIKIKKSLLLNVNSTYAYLKSSSELRPLVCMSVSSWDHIHTHLCWPGERIRGVKVRKSIG